MSKTDPARERSAALRRSRVARQGLVLGAVAGSLGIAGALGLSAATSQAATPPSDASNPSQGTQGGSTTPAKIRIVQGDDDHGEHESDDDGRSWVPARPSPGFKTGGGTGSGGSTGNTAPAPAPAPAPQATTGGS
jgi:hypothetical protein